jgi:hypothetical protein
LKPYVGPPEVKILAGRFAFCIMAIAFCISIGSAKLALSTALGGRTMLSAFGEEVLSGFRNSFGKYFGTDHMLLEGWRSYLTHLRTRPDDGTIPVCFHSGAMAMFPTMLEIFSTGGKEQALKRLKDADGPSRLWEEYRACLADEIDAEILDQYKKAFYGGTWFIIATFMALADEKRDEHFIRGMEALRDEISEFRTDLKQWIIREAGKPRDYQAPETVLRTKREGPVKIDPVEALVRQAVSMNWKQVHEIKKEDVAADDFAQAMVSIRFARGNEEAVVRRKDATVTLVRRHAPPTFDGFDELEEWVA